ncbi:hypothetical protein [Kribbella sp. NPDC051718]|uniref:hypothetical protein n=1 Tax=Kribbella sp. NPDC051718 TaxID=3155168 RepID=UPI0034433239
MAEQADKGSILDQAAADGSITDARHRAVDPVPIVVADVTDGADLATLESADGVPSAPIWRVRRKLSPRPVPGNRRRKPPVPAPVTDEEPIPAEEMDDVGTQPDKAAKTADAEKAVTPDVKAEETPAAVPSAEASTGGRGATATATKPAKPKTAAEIVAEQKAREKAAAESPQDDTAVTKPVTRQPAAPSAAAVPGTTTPKTAAKPVAAAAAKKTASSSPGSGKAALSAVGSGVRRFRNLLASLVWLIAVIAAAVLALGALFTALDQANQSNEIVKWVLERGHDLVGPFKDLFRLETAKNTLLVNWGIAALVYLIIGKIAERFIRP